MSDDRADVTFDLPLDPSTAFTADALMQLADQIVGKPIRIPGGPLTTPRGTDRVGTVTAAAVIGDRVRCTAEVKTTIVDMIAGYGANIAASKTTAGANGTLLVTAVERVSGADALPENLLPPRARRPNPATPALRKARDKLRTLLAELLEDGITVHGWDDGTLVITDRNSGHAETYIDSTEGALGLEQLKRPDSIDLPKED